MGELEKRGTSDSDSDDESVPAAARKAAALANETAKISAPLGAMEDSDSDFEEVKPPPKVPSPAKPQHRTGTIVTSDSDSENIRPSKKRVRRPAASLPMESESSESEQKPPPATKAIAKAEESDSSSEAPQVASKASTGEATSKAQLQDSDSESEDAQPPAKVQKVPATTSPAVAVASSQPAVEDSDSDAEPAAKPAAKVVAKLSVEPAVEAAAASLQPAVADSDSDSEEPKVTGKQASCVEKSVAKDIVDSDSDSEPPPKANTDPANGNLSAEKVAAAKEVTKADDATSKANMNDPDSDSESAKSASKAKPQAAAANKISSLKEPALLKGNAKGATLQANDSDSDSSDAPAAAAAKAKTQPASVVDAAKAKGAASKANIADSDSDSESVMSASKAKPPAAASKISSLKEPAPLKGNAKGATTQVDDSDSDSSDSDSDSSDSPAAAAAKAKAQPASIVDAAKAKDAASNAMPQAAANQVPSVKKPAPLKGSAKGATTQVGDSDSDSSDAPAAKAKAQPASVVEAAKAKGIAAQDSDIDSKPAPVASKARAQEASSKSGVKGAAPSKRDVSGAALKADACKSGGDSQLALPAPADKKDSDNAGGPSQKEVVPASKATACEGKSTQGNGDAVVPRKKLQCSIPAKQATKKKESPTPKAPNKKCAQDNFDSLRLHVSGLSKDMNAEKLRKVFESCGKMTDVYVPSTKGEHRFGFVTFEDEHGVTAALSRSGLHGVTGAPKLKVVRATPKPKEDSSQSKPVATTMKAAEDNNTSTASSSINSDDVEVLDMTIINAMIHAQAARDFPALERLATKVCERSRAAQVAASTPGLHSSTSSSSAAQAAASSPDAIGLDSSTSSLSAAQAAASTPDTRGLDSSTSSSSAAQAAASTPDTSGASTNTTVIVTGLPFKDFDEEAFRKEFAVCGEIETSNLRLRSNGKSYGFGSITFKSRRAMKKALAFSGTQHFGRTLEVAKENAEQAKEEFQTPKKSSKRKDVPENDTAEKVAMTKAQKVLETDGSSNQKRKVAENAEQAKEESTVGRGVSKRKAVPDNDTAEKVPMTKAKKVDEKSVRRKVK